MVVWVTPPFSLVPPLGAGQSQHSMMANRAGKSWRLVAGKDKKERQRHCNGSSGDGLHDVAGRLRRSRGLHCREPKSRGEMIDDVVSRDGDGGG